MLSSQEDCMSKARKILIFENTFTLADHLLKMWINIAQQSVEQSNRFTAALSGGRSPMEFYCKLSNYKDFDLWARTHLFLGDERFVPHDDNNSNFKMIKQNLLDYVHIPPENIHSIATDLKNVELAAHQYKNELVQFFEFKEGAPCFDLILLGIGDDGHTASLFPDDEQVDDSEQLVLPVSLPHLKQERISLALPVINNAKNVIVLVLGAQKSEIMKEIIKGKSDIPVSKVKLTNGQLTYLLDKEAAQQLSYRDSYSHEGQAILLQNPDLRSDVT